MSNGGELRGWKESDLGQVPEDWHVGTLSNLGAQITSGSRGWAQFYSDYGDLFVRITNLRRSNIQPDLSSPRFVNLEGSNTEANRTRLQLGDVLVSITADIGIIGYVDESFPIPSYINQHIARVRFTDGSVSSKFIAYYLSSWVPQKRFVGSTDTGAKAGLNLATVSSLVTVVPPFAEQRQIVDILSDIDHEIAVLERLVAKRRSIKQGMMQHLLTGKTRLPGFSGPWRSGPLKQFMPLQRGFDLPNSRVVPGAFPIVYSNGIGGTHNAAMAKGPGVVTGRSGTIGKVHYVDRDYWPHNTALWVTNFSRTDAKFAYYFLTHLGLERFSGGSGVPTLNRNDAHGFEIRLPSDRLEQRAIADTLVAADEAIDRLRIRLDKIKAIKQGVMQQLLTGRIRLPVEKGQHE